MRIRGSRLRSWGMRKGMNRNLPDGRSQPKERYGNVRVVERRLIVRKFPSTDIPSGFVSLVTRLPVIPGRLRRIGSLKPD
jgi:hypothetical protein